MGSICSFENDLNDENDVNEKIELREKKDSNTISINPPSGPQLIPKPKYKCQVGSLDFFDTDCKLELRTLSGQKSSTISLCGETTDVLQSILFSHNITRATESAPVMLLYCGKKIYFDASWNKLAILHMEVLDKIWFDIEENIKVDIGQKFLAVCVEDVVCMIFSNYTTKWYKVDDIQVIHQE